MRGRGQLLLSFVPNTWRECLCAGNDRTVYVWDVGTANIIRKFWEHDKRVNAVK